MHKRGRLASLELVWHQDRLEHQFVVTINVQRSDRFIPMILVECERVLGAQSNAPGQSEHLGLEDGASSSFV